ncbi:uncharacterized protein ARB_03536 [Trichophyton benhamiae CBS 112371]|uniref:Uncharacterized protein n=2 Tax=Trichophyton TaxID=5550 RepID=D4B4Z6_ARTBC|nr:uncharacterized protein ARB_03536 [Trichophyton benhamiae CBS 112371]XP_003018415.1 uncharacterized protein TRV_07569 [Trichophyton verrucosum HKI 0517]EFE29641.1 hypothetical protein ARB_03536 [Trichophyton benhamiae CBS 112371]EFE37770.1 hypothetical protein TRV_07569 [Trichophyton verrucosum HKI 0517]
MLSSKRRVKSNPPRHEPATEGPKTFSTSIEHAIARSRAEQLVTEPNSQTKITKEEDVALLNAPDFRGAIKKGPFGTCLVFEEVAQSARDINRLFPSALIEPMLRSTIVSYLVQG